MTEPVIRVCDLGKKYVIRHEAGGARYESLRDVLAGSAKRLFRRFRGATIGSGGGGSREEFWALRDVSFDVGQGEVLGVIGRNGAGKSTLLKVLSRITEPTAGRIEVDGRVGSLLEVGTGFHPELTGRENVYLNGTILGMTRREIAKKFDEIVAFAEVEKFLDTPVKRYSSGMYTRLAFAVAAHLEPEVLVVDEVLAVGDAQFQKKSLGKMGDVARGGRTVLFVSHNMAAVQSLCTRAVWLREGRVVTHGPAGDVIASYLSDRNRRGDGRAPTRDLGAGLRVSGFQIEPAEPRTGCPVSLEFQLGAVRPTQLTHLCLIVYSALEVRTGIIDLRPRREPYVIEIDGGVTVRCRLADLPLVEGEYEIGLYLVTGDGRSVNIPDLAPLSIGHAVLDEGFVPYPNQYRGVVEFDATVSIADSRRMTKIAGKR